jgi:ATP-dependent exoDNAse (exonuclease V) beta subunit
MKKFLLEKLEQFNDPNFIFDPVKHRYTYLGEEFISVTKFIQQFHKPFEQGYWSQRKAEEAGVPQEWILNEWKKLNDYANEIGTETHNWIEDYFNKNWKSLPTNLDVINRINKFNIIYAKQLHKLEPLKFEVRVFSKKWKIAGMIDALFLYRGRIFIIDYKTNKNFTTNENIKYPEKLLHPFSEYNKNHLNEYSIQISLYALILKEWGFDVAGGYLVHIGPNEEPAKMYKCVDMTKILENYIDSIY